MKNQKKNSFTSTYGRHSVFLGNLVDGWFCLYHQRCYSYTHRSWYGSSLHYFDVHDGLYYSLHPLTLRIFVDVVRSCIPWGIRTYLRRFVFIVSLALFLLQTPHVRSCLVLYLTLRRLRQTFVLSPFINFAKLNRRADVTHSVISVHCQYRPPHSRSSSSTSLTLFLVHITQTWFSTKYASSSPTFILSPLCETLSTSLTLTVDTHADARTVSLFYMLTAHINHFTRHIPPPHHSNMFSLNFSSLFIDFHFHASTLRT